MTPERFARLAQAYHLNLTVFHQRTWRAAQFQDDPGGLCAGLVWVWLHLKCDVDDALASLASHCDKVVRAQVESADPSALDPEAVTAADLALLRRIYGHDDVRRIQDDLAATGGAVANMARSRFAVRSLTCGHHDMSSARTLHALDDPEWAGLLSLRHTAQPCDGGHRAGVLCRRDRFWVFDPNRGEVAGPRAVMASYLSAYVRHWAASKSGAKSSVSCTYFSNPVPRISLSI